MRRGRERRRHMWRACEGGSEERMEERNKEGNYNCSLVIDEKGFAMFASY